MARGQLRVYLGAAPGVGKTYKMLEEGHRRLARGTDVVVGLVETHGRPQTAVQLAGLEVLPRKTLSYRGATFTELDVESVLQRAPEVVLVDEMAHTNVPGSRNAKRWEDIEEILAAGITVLSTVNIQHLESLNDVVAQIAGVPQRETIPDEIVRAAEQVELVDMTPEALRRRMVHGNIYPPEKIDAALSNYFRQGNLTALRELALLWLADKVDDQLDAYRAEHGIAETWEARERIVVALTGGPEGDTLIRRAARIAARSRGAELVAVHVTRSDGLTGADPANLARQRALAESLGGFYRQVVGSDIPAALLDFARGVNATQLVLGASRRGRIAQLFSRGVGVTTVARSGSIDVHLVTHDEIAQGRQARTTRWLPPSRQLLGLGLGSVGLPLLSIVLSHWRDDLSIASCILLFLTGVVGIALLGGLLPALVSAVIAFALLGRYFTPPVGEWTVSDPQDLLALGVFALVAVVVSAAVDVAARKTREATRATADAELLSTLAGSVLRGERTLPALLTQVEEAFGASAVTLLERRDDPANPTERRNPKLWNVIASVGAQPCTAPDESSTDVQIDERLALALRGVVLPAADRRALEGFAVHIGVALRQQRLAEQAATAEGLAQSDRLRSALLTAVSHDLRTPLASAKAAIAGLRDDQVTFSDADQAELLRTADESLDQLHRLVANLLDMSRLQAGALGIFLQPTSVEEAIPRAVDALPEPIAAQIAANVEIDIAPKLPEVSTDAALLERILVNLVENAAKFNPGDRPLAISASQHGAVVEIRVVDHGPGIPEADRDLVFQPFQRLGDRDNQTGVGLGLALARGLAQAMGGDVSPDNTPGGGLTMIISLPVAPRELP